MKMRKEKELGVSCFNSTLKEQVKNNTMNFHKINKQFDLEFFNNFNNFSSGISQIFQPLILKINLCWIRQEHSAPYPCTQEPYYHTLFAILWYQHLGSCPLIVVNLSIMCAMVRSWCAMKECSNRTFVSNEEEGK
jgi:hypothetical protein